MVTELEAADVATILYPIISVQNYFKRIYNCADVGAIPLPCVRHTVLDEI